MTTEEIQLWLEESKHALAFLPGRFGVFVDMRELQLLSTDVQKVFVEGQRYYRQKGMVRSVVILDNSTLTIQFKRLALQSDIYDWERYVDASSVPNWEEIGLKWVIEGIDPDAERRMRIAARSRVLV